MLIDTKNLSVSKKTLSPYFKINFYVYEKENQNSRRKCFIMQFVYPPIRLPVTPKGVVVCCATGVVACPGIIVLIEI